VIGYNSLLKFRECFSGHYQGRGYWNEDLDIAIILADIMVQTNQSEHAICDSLMPGVSDALSACKLHDMSMEICKQVYAEYTSTASATSLLFELPIALGNSYRQSQDFDKAEESLLRGARDTIRIYGGLAYAEKYFSELVVELLYTYHDRNLVEFNKTGPLADLYHLLNVILYASGTAKISKTLSSQQLMLVAAKYRKQAGARNALMMACKTESVSAFRTEVFSWKAKGANIINGFTGAAPTAFGGPPKGTSAFARSRSRECAPVIYKTCANPSCPDRVVVAAKLSLCSKCKAVEYCTRECQVAHWKVHKHTCAASEVTIEK
jgi:hypothetical protein